MNPDQTALDHRCQTVFGSAGEAIRWVGDVRANSGRLDSDADGLIQRLRQVRNLCRRLGAAAQRLPSVGVFGMSQAGKSYLISSLARAEGGQLDTILGGQRLSFIGHVNPPGGGKEATGLVTRFTRQSSEPPEGFPVKLSLFCEADIVKVLGNSYFEDFDQESVDSLTDHEEIRRLLAELSAQRLPAANGGLSEDDLVDLSDYFEQLSRKAMSPLRADFWPTAIELAPCLDLESRARLFSILWGGIQEFSETYLILSKALAELAHARTAFAPLEALVTESTNGYEWRADSILNVDVLDGLRSSTSSTLPILPISGSQPVNPHAVSRAVLAALTAEMEFVLADPPVASMLERVDLLDFPGYRGRLGITSLDQVNRETKRDDGDPVSQLFLRGKVAFLFERYTEDQEMNVLLMCTRCDIQIEVTTLAPVLDRWVHSTQGETPETRSGSDPGLVWVETQFDRRLEAKPGQTTAQQQEEWSSMLHITLKERFSRCEWLHEWTADTPFSNVFLVRKPGMLRSTFTLDEHDREVDFVSEAEQTRLEAQKAIFLANESVNEYVRQAEAAWDAVLHINDGGMGRLAAYLNGVAVLDRKLERISAQVERVAEEVTNNRLAPYFQSEGAEEESRKREIAERVDAVIREQPDSFGELLSALQPASERLRGLYLRAESVDDIEAGPSEESPRRRAGLITLPGSAAISSNPSASTKGGRAGRFAKSAVSEWIKQLRALSEDDQMRRFLQLPADALQALTDELITAFHRCRVETRLIGALSPLEEKRSTTRLGIADQQVLLARYVISEFVDFIGFSKVPLEARPDSPIAGRKIFEPPAPIPRGRLPELPIEGVPYSGMFIVDWLTGFASLAVDNAGHSAGREISPEQNLRLGEILETMRKPGEA